MKQRVKRTFSQQALPKRLSPYASHGPSREVTAELTLTCWQGLMPLLMRSPSLRCLSLPVLLPRALALLQDPTDIITCPLPSAWVRCPKDVSQGTHQQEREPYLLAPCIRGKGPSLRLASVYPS